jgi:A/G-specific adenine glycosylase
LVPMRETTMLLVRDEHGRVLLERRPPTGVWAQLWSVPETSDAETARDVLRDRFGVLAEVQRSLAAFVHTFSHYHLRISPVLAVGVAEPCVTENNDRRWFSREELPALGLPAPVRRLLENAFEDEKWREPCIA